MRRLLLLLALLPIQAQAIEEDAYKFLHFMCLPVVGHFELSSTTMINVGDLLYPSGDVDNTIALKKHGLHIEGKGSFTCKLGNETIQAKYEVPTGATGGRCSGGTRSFVSLWIGKTQIADKLVFNDDCYNATTTKIDYNNGILGLVMHPLRNASGGAKTYYSYIDLDLEAKKFTLRKEDRLPITMDDIENELSKLAGNR